MTVKVLFVCLGNICRSPMAEGVFQKMVDDAGMSDTIAIDSAGTGSWHVGQTAHHETRRVLARHGIDYRSRARMVRGSELRGDSTYVIAMDEDNIQDLKRRFGEVPNLYRLLEFAENHSEQNVPDPYYAGNFDKVYDLVEDGCRGLLAAIVKNENLAVK